MTLSSLFQRPALTTIISGGVTDSVITSSPAILMGFYPGGVEGAGINWDCYVSIKSGTTELLAFRNIFQSGFSVPPASINSNGIDCPNGIKVTVSGIDPQYLANSRLTINYILK